MSVLWHRMKAEAIQLRDKKRSKQDAMKSWLCALYLAAALLMLGCTREELICFGDGYNDMTMLEYAGMGVAMGNAKEEVKAVAHYITSGNDEDGIVEVIDKFVLD